MNIQYDENHWKQMEAALGMLLGSGYGYGTPLIDDLVELSTIVDEAIKAVDTYDVDGVVHLMDHTDASIYGEFRDKYKWLADFSSEIGNSLYHEVDRPFYENIDAYAVAMRDLDINKFTTENKYGITGTSTDSSGNEQPFTKSEITLSDLLSGGTELENFARKEFELWLEMNDVPEAQKLKYEDYQQYMMYSHSFIYHSLNDQLVGTVKSVVVGTTLFGLGFVPIVGPILGAGFGIMEVKEAVQGVDASGRELDIFERIFKGAIGVTSIGFSGWKLAKDLGGMNAVKGVSGAKGTGNYNKGYVTGDDWENYFKQKYGAENVTNVTKTTISSAERAKLNSWEWPPPDDLYLKYKDIYNNDLYFNQVTGVPRYPVNDGFLSEWPDIVNMAKGDVIDRIGSNGSGQYFSPVGSTFESRALPPFMQNQPYTKYKVLKPFETTTGEVAPWFGQPGAGTQHYTNFLIKDRYGNLVKANVENLLEWGYITPIE